MIKNTEWTKERCMEAASHCSTRSEFKSKFPGARKIARSNGWIDEINATYFPEKASCGKQNRVYVIYAYEFPKENSVYVGLTFNLEYREKKHSTSSNDDLFLYCKNHNTILPTIKIIKDNIDSKDATSLHHMYYDQYVDSGWLMINDESSVGINSNHTDITRTGAYEAARQCKSKSEFRERFYNEYRKSKRYGWFDSYDWFERPSVKGTYVKEPVKWTKEATFEEAKKYRTISEFAKNCDGGYRMALRNGWIVDYIWFEKRKTVTSMTEEEVREVAMQYTSLKEFRDEHYTMVRFAKDMGWLDNYEWLKKGYSKHTKEEIIEIARKYDTLSDFEKYDNKAFRAAKYKKWLPEFIWLKKKQRVYTKELCAEVAGQYKTYHEFRVAEPNMYSRCRINGWLEEFTWLVDDIKKTTKQKEEQAPKYSNEELEENSKDLTYEECKENAEKCYYVFGFKENHPFHYYKSVKERWIGDFDWLKTERAPRNFYTYDYCKAEAEKYDDYGEFRKNSPLAYRKAKQDGWIKEWELSSGHKPNNYWNDERCFECASKCAYRSDFRMRYPAAYQYAKRTGILSVVIEKYFPEKVTDEYSENEIFTVYAYEIEQTHAVYVGVTHLPKQREIRHRNAFVDSKHTTRLSKYCKLNGFDIPEVKVLEDNIKPEEASEKEIYWYNKYRDAGWFMINKEEKLGSLGHKIKKMWTYERVRECAEECKINGEFREKYPQAYVVAKQNRWLSEFTWLERTNRGPERYWTEERCCGLAEQYSTFSEFKKNEPTAYEASRTYGYLEKFDWLENDMSRPKWTEEECAKVSHECLTISEFRKKYETAYRRSKENGWLEKFDWLVATPKPNKVDNGTKHRKYVIVNGVVPLTYEENYAVAKKYTLMNDFRTKEVTAYNRARRLGWLKDYTWLKRGDAPQTFEEVEATARKYSSMDDFYNNDTQTYKVARKNGWIDKFDWLKRKHRPRWTFETAAQEASKYSSASELFHKDRYLYDSAKRHGWIDKFVFSGSSVE